jgi:hypothetical protein
VVPRDKVTFNDLTPDEQEVYALAAQQLLDDEDDSDGEGPCEVCAEASPDHKHWCPILVEDGEPEEVD